MHLDFEIGPRHLYSCEKIGAGNIGALVDAVCTRVTLQSTLLIINQLIVMVLMHPYQGGKGVRMWERLGYAQR